MSKDSAYIERLGTRLASAIAAAGRGPCCESGDRLLVGDCVVAEVADAAERRLLRLLRGGAGDLADCAAEIVRLRAVCADIRAAAVEGEAPDRALDKLDEALGLGRAGPETADSEAAFLECYRASDYLAPLATVDVAIFTVRDGRLQVLLARRANHPHRGLWSLPGGFYSPEDADETAAARRKLHVKTGMKTPYLEQLGTFGGPARDPRGWSITTVYFALVADNPDWEPSFEGGVSDVRWFPVDGEGVDFTLAFDHNRLLCEAVARLRSKTDYTLLPAHLLPERFTLPELQRIYEVILGRKLNKMSMRRKLTESGVIEPIEGAFSTESKRPAQLYRVKPGAGTHYFARTLAGEGKSVGQIVE